MATLVQLQGPGDRQTLHDLLQQSLVDHLQASPETSGTDVEAELYNKVDQVATLLDAWIPIRGQLGALDPARGLGSPALPLIPPPPVDEEVRALEAEVTVAAQQVATLRTSMQTALQEELALRLASTRPSSEASPAEADADAGSASREPVFPALEPGLQALQDQLEAAAAQIPSLRARLEESISRMSRIATAMQAEEARAREVAPGTVEKVLAGRTPGPGSDGVAPSSPPGSDEEAGEGADLRRALAASLDRPLD
ncbi:hypothetical protein ACKKBG_A22820 [Auxenochlorella protothecoides x Auxenochlorella symbiontica]